MPTKFCVIIICLFFSCSSFAATGQEQLQKRLSQSGEQLLQQQQMERSIAGTNTVPSIASAKEQDDNNKNTECLDIERINFLGIKSVNIEKIKIAAQNNKCITKYFLQNIQQEIQVLYVKKGYITSRVYFDLKKLDLKEIDIVAEEGFLQEITMLDRQTKQEDKSLSARLQKASAFPFAEGKILNLRRIEQGVEQMNKLSSNDITLQIRPGDTEGASVVVLDNKLLPRNSVGFSFDNSGTENTGKYKAGLSFSRDNLLSLNDNLYINLNNTVGNGTGTKYSRGISGSFTVPIGYWTFTQSLNYSRYLTTTKGIVTDIESSGNYFNNVTALEYLFSRGSNYKASAGAELSLKQSNNYIEDIYIDVSSRILSTASLYLSGIYFGEGSTTFSKLSINHGLPILGAKADDGPSESPKAQFTTLAAYVNYSKNFGPINYNLSADGQYSFDYLFASEQFIIGGGSLRGFRQNNAYGEHGFTIKQDLRESLLNIMGHSQNKLIDTALSKLFLGVFADYGYVAVKNGGDSRAADAGVKMSYYDKYLYGTISWGRSFYRTEDIPDEGSIINFNIGVNILF